MAKRVQSPSSIKTYKNCPRKYYYTYVMGIKAPPNVHMVRGNIAHSVLENFFDIDTSAITMENHEAHLKMVVQKLLLKEWQNYKKELDGLELLKEQEMHYFEETVMMLFNWVEMFSKRLQEKEGTFQDRFKALTPARELQYVSEKFQVRGFIDAIEDNGEKKVRIMDYKTSKRANLNEHILQLAIYSLLYYEKHGYMPEQVGVYFLKGKVEKTIDVDEELLEKARTEIKYIHEVTETEDINHYPKIITPLCKWSTGQCEHYDICRPHG